MTFTGGIELEHRAEMGENSLSSVRDFIFSYFLASNLNKAEEHSQHLHFQLNNRSTRTKCEIC